MPRRAVLTLVILLAATWACAQIRGSRPPDRSLSGVRGGTIGDPEDAPTRGSGSINGTIATTDDRPVPDARVELRGVSTGRSVRSVYSNAAGRFEILNVPPGEYELVVSSGLSESRERLVVRGTPMFATVRLSGAPPPEAGNAATVSVAQMNVPDKARKAYNKAQEAVSKQKLDEAREQLAKALNIYPDYAEALTLRGVLKLEQNQDESAREDLEKAVECDHSYGLAQVVLGSAYNRLRRYDDALRVLDRAVSLSPTAWQAYFERGRARLAKQQYPESLRDLNKSQQLAGRDIPVVHLVKANALLGMQSYAEAQAEIQAYLDRAPNGNNADEARRTLAQLKAATATAQK